MADEPQQTHRHRRPPDPDDDRTWIDIGREQLHRPGVAFTAGCVAMLAVVGLIVVGLGAAAPRKTEASAPAANAPAAPSVAAAPSAAASAAPTQDPMHPSSVALAPPPVDTDTVSPDQVKQSFAPPDGPAPDMPPYGIDAKALLDEIRSHGVRVDDGMAAKLVEIGNENVARGDPDLNAWDEQIMTEVKATFPYFTKQNRIDVTRCLAEYVERVIARNNHTIPPDERDDHKEQMPPGAGN